MEKIEMVEKMIGHFRGSQNLGSEKAIFGYILDRMVEAGMLPPNKEEYDRSLDCIYGESIAGRECLHAIMHKGSLSEEDFLEIWDRNRKTNYNDVKHNYRWETGMNKERTKQKMFLQEMTDLALKYDIIIEEPLVAKSTYEFHYSPVHKLYWDVDKREYVLYNEDE